MAGQDNRRMMDVNPNAHRDMLPPRPTELADRMERRRRGSMFETTMDRADLQMNNNNISAPSGYTIDTNVTNVILGPLPRTTN